ncbi:MAG: MFS transporter [Candidatus Hermodarchaeota archaeon]
METNVTKTSFRHYLYFLFGQQFSMLGSLIVNFVITWWITIETGSAVYLSISTFLMFLPQIIVTPFSGVIADRWNKKVIIVISDTLQAMSTTLLFVFFLVDFQSIWFVLGMNTFRAGLFAFQYPTVLSLIPTMVPKEHLSRINGINFLFNGLIYALGPMIAATLLAIFPITQIFLIDGITFLIALIPLLIIKIPKVYQTTEEAVKKSMFKDFKTGLLTIKLIPGLLAMILFAMVWNFIHRPWAVLTPYFIRYTHDGSAFNLALLMMAMQLGNITGAIVMSIKKTWKHKIKINVIGASLFFLGQIPAILAPKGNFILMMISLFPGAVLFPITVSTYLAILQTVVSKDKVGRIMSIDHMISMAIAPIGALIAGPIAEIFGIINLFLTCAILGIIFPLFVWFFTKIRHLEIIDREKMAEAEAEKKKEEEIIEIPEVVQIADSIE